MTAIRIDPGVFAHAARLRLAAPTTATGHQLGEHRSAARGQGLEFVDHRPYRPGDDLRRVDWNAYRRLRSVLVRLFAEDRSLRISLTLDATGSMGVGRPRKIDHAASLAAALALLGLLRRDTVRLGCIGGRGSSPQGPLAVGSHARALPRMIAALQQVSPDGTAETARALLSQADGWRADTALLLSDMLVEDDEIAATLRALATVGRRAVLLHVLSPDDLELDLSGARELLDAETGETMLVEGTPEIHARYVAELTRWRAAVRRAAARYGVQVVDVPTPQPLAKLLRDALLRSGVTATRA